MPCPPAAVASERSTTTRWPTSVSQTVMRGVLAWAEQRRDPLADRGGDLVDRQPGVEHEVVVGVGGGHLAERLAHPLVELHGLALDPVALLEAAEPVLRLEVEHHGQVRAQVAGGPAVDARSTSAGTRSRPAPW